MAEYPALPLWTDAYLGDTNHLTTIEHGAYLLLLIVMWRTREKRLPNDDAKLARYARLTLGQWRRMRETIMAFFRVDGDWITQGRLTDEATFVRQKSKSQKDNIGRRWLKNNETTDTTVLPNAYQTDTPTPTPTPKVKEGSVEAPLAAAPTTNLPAVIRPIDDELLDLPSNLVTGLRRGTRLSPDWQLPDDWRAWAKAERTDLDPDATAANFRDYWIAKAGRDGAKLDWSATWRIWVRNQRAPIKPFGQSPIGDALDDLKRRLG